MIVPNTQLVLAPQRVMSSTKELFSYNWATFFSKTDLPFALSETLQFCLFIMEPKSQLFFFSEAILNDDPQRSLHFPLLLLHPKSPSPSQIK